MIISAACTILLAGIGLVLWASRDNHLVRTPAQVRADVARHRADRLTRQTLEDTATCEAIWQLTEIPSQRKETGQ
ncbi:hypothetical protein ACIQKB_03945 [Streptomyces sp. NPDC092046]|uniref:hypothetical protein n=1 Tax=Streptomyces sp. NPDC092046 TaxID=3366009 RepID=UPI0037FCA00B